MSFCKYIKSTLQVGTFLIRFSDSELGGVTVAWISSEQNLNYKITFGKKNWTCKYCQKKLVSGFWKSKVWMLGSHPKKPWWLLMAQSGKLWFSYIIALDIDTCHNITTFIKAVLKKILQRTRRRTRRKWQCCNRSPGKIQNSSF